MAADAGEQQLTQDAGTGFNGGPFELFAQPELSQPAPRRTERRPSPASMRSRSTSRDVSGTRPGSVPPHDDLGAGAPADDCTSAGAATRWLTDGTGPATIDVHSRDGTEIGITSNSTVVTTQLFRALRAVDPADLVRGARARCTSPPRLATPRCGSCSTAPAPISVCHE